MIHVSQFYACSKVELAAELYYICELGKYLKESYSEVISIDGIVLDSCLRKSRLWHYFKMAVDQGWVVNHGLSDEDIACVYTLIDLPTYRNVLFTTDEVIISKEEKRRRDIDPVYNFTTPLKMSVVFSSYTNNCWVWTLGGKNSNDLILNNMALCRSYCEQSWLSLVAYVAVERLFHKVPLKLHFVFGYDIVYVQTLLSYFLILHEETDCFKSWCSFEFDNVSSDLVLHSGYVAWFIKGIEKGLLERHYTLGEKKKYMSELGIEEGDLVMFYKRSISQGKSRYKEVKSCQLAIVRCIKTHSIDLEVISTTRTKAQAKKEYMDLTTAARSLYDRSYSSLPFEKFNSRLSSFDLVDVGIHYMLFDEPYFIVTLEETEDCVDSFVDNGDIVKELKLTQNERAYWILKDYNVSFNEEKFKKLYFNGRVDKYEEFMNLR